MRCSAAEKSALSSVDYNNSDITKTATLSVPQILAYDFRYPTRAASNNAAGTRFVSSQTIEIGRFPS